MKRKVFFILALLSSMTAVCAEQTCRDVFKVESDQCRMTFRQCMSNPFLESLCSGQLENCSDATLGRLELCENRQKICMDTFISRQNFCKASYYRCTQKPGSIYSCTDDLDRCSNAAQSSVELCYESSIRYYNEEKF